jgi:hypothetical protein
MAASGQKHNVTGLKDCALQIGLVVAKKVDADAAASDE